MDLSFESISKALAKNVDSGKFDSWIPYLKSYSATYDSWKVYTTNSTNLLGGIGYA